MNSTAERLQENTESPPIDTPEPNSLVINGTPARIGPTGGLLMTGNPGNKGGTGRPKSFRKHLAELRHDSAVQEAVRLNASDRDHRHWPAAVKLLTDYDPNKPAERREMSGAVTINVVVEREGPRRTQG